MLNRLRQLISRGDLTGLEDPTSSELPDDEQDSLLLFHGARPSSASTRKQAAYQTVAKTVEWVVSEYTAGLMSPEKASAALSNLAVRDSHRARWTVGARTGNWYRSIDDGVTWHQAEPGATQTAPTRDPLAQFDDILAEPNYAPLGEDRTTVSEAAPVESIADIDDDFSDIGPDTPEIEDMLNLDITPAESFAEETVVYPTERREAMFSDMDWEDPRSVTSLTVDGVEGNSARLPNTGA